MTNKSHLRQRVHCLRPGRHACRQVWAWPTPSFATAGLRRHNAKALRRLAFGVRTARAAVSLQGSIGAEGGGRQSIICGARA